MHRYQNYRKLTNHALTTYRPVKETKFDWEFYTKYYHDLKNLDESGAREHWNRYGRKEIRYNNAAVAIKKETPNFDYKFYTKYYHDLKDYGEYAAYNHWLIYGKNEVCRHYGKNEKCRFCSSNPLNRENLAFYLTLYPELNGKGNAEIHKHWKNNNNINDPKQLRHKIGISISTYSNDETDVGRYEMIEQCLTSVLNCINNYNKDMIYINIIADTVTEEHMRILKKYPFTVIENSKNMGIAHTKNVGMHHIYKNKCQFGFLMDDDNIINDNSIFITYVNAMIRTNCHQFSNIGAVEGEVCNIVKINNHPVRQLGALSGNFLTFTRKTIETAGYFMLMPGKYGHEHCEYTRRCCDFNLIPFYIDVANGEELLNNSNIQRYPSLSLTSYFDPKGRDENGELMKSRLKKRILYSGRGFDYNYYIKNNSDLLHLSEKEAYRHWIIHGENEGRKCWSEDTPEPYVIS